MNFTVFGDNRIEADWFVGLSPLLKQATIQMIGGRGQNLSIIDSLIEYDRPDIILLADQKPVMVLEKTREVPTGHNVGQRVARLVKAIELGVPTVKFFPFDAQKHGEYASACNLNIRLLLAFKKMATIHNTPILAVNWPVDKHYELIDDGTENNRVEAIVHDYLSSKFDPSCQEILAQIKWMEKEYAARLSAYPPYADPPPSAKLVNTSQFLNGLPYTLDTVIEKALLNRDQSVIYKMNMTPAKCKRQDPYTGTQFIYDYLWCRNGNNVSNKSKNLILHFPKIDKITWNKLNPNNKKTKSCNWYLTANALIFSDGIELLRK